MGTEAYIVISVDEHTGRVDRRLCKHLSAKRCGKFTGRYPTGE